MTLNFSPWNVASVLAVPGRWAVPAVPCCQLNIDTPKRVPMYSPGRKTAVITARAFMDELSRVEATAILALRLLSSWAI